MPTTTVNPTRMELTRLKGRLRTAQRGHKLLKDKRDELMKQFMEVVREDLALRQKVEQSLTKAYGSFTVASALPAGSTRATLPVALYHVLVTCGLEIMPLASTPYTLLSYALPSASCNWTRWPVPPATLSTRRPYTVCATTWQWAIR